MSILHWELRKTLHLWHKGEKGKMHARFPVFVVYTLHANVRNRAFPSIDTLCKESGYGPEAVVEAKQWLVERDALKPVPFAERVELERRHQRMDVMQITGHIVLDGRTIQTLFVAETQDDANITESENKVGKNKVGETEGSKAIKVSKEEENPAAVFWRENMKMLLTSSKELEEFKLLMETYPKQRLVSAMEIAKGRGKYSVAYVRGILHNEDAEAAVKVEKPVVTTTPASKRKDYTNAS